MIDKNFTMCRDFENSGGKLDKTNFPHISFLYYGIRPAIRRKLSGINKPNCL